MGSLITISIPDVGKVRKLSENLVRDFWNKTGDKSSLYSSHQGGIVFDPEKVKPITCELIGKKANPTFVSVMGHTGEFITAIKNAGYDTIYTDLADSYVALGREKGLLSIKRHAENPINCFDPIYVAFEPIPLSNIPFADMLLFLNALSKSRYGIILAGGPNQLDQWKELIEAYHCKCKTIPYSTKYKDGKEIEVSITLISARKRSIDLIRSSLEIIMIGQKHEEIDFSLFKDTYYEDIRVSAGLTVDNLCRRGDYPMPAEVKKVGIPYGLFRNHVEPALILENTIGLA
jgi:hypothetical protein